MLLQWWSSVSAIPFPSRTCLVNSRHSKGHYNRLFLRKPTTAALFEEVAQLAHNKVLVAAGVSAAIGQLSKPLTSVVIYGKDFDFKAAFQAGGFPSTHSSAVVATATSLGLERGLSDSIFGLTVVYAGLVMYDSQGVRREVGNHAKVLNKLLLEKPQVNSSISYKDRDRLLNNEASPPLNDLGSVDGPLLSEEVTKTSLVLKLEKETGKTIFSTDEDEGFRKATLKESIGHTEVEVIAGALLGFVVSLIVSVIL